MIVKLKKEIRSYYAAPYKFTKENPEQNVSNKLGEYLLGTGHFEKVKDIDGEIKIENTNLDPEGEIKDLKEKAENENANIDSEEEVSEEKKLYDEAQKESKKKSTKKEDK